MMTFIPLFVRSILVKLIAGPKCLSRKSQHLQACILKLDRIGDFVLALSAIRQLTQHFGEHNCALVVFQPVIELAEKEFPTATIIGISQPDGGIKNAITLFLTDSNAFKAFEFENLVCLRYQRSLVHNLVLSWINARHSIGFENSDTFGVYAPDEAISRFTFTENLPLPDQRSNSTCVEIERHRAIVRHVMGMNICDESILPALTSTSSSAGDSIVVAPFTSKRIKDYPSDRLLSTLQKIRAQTKAPILLCGAQMDKQRLDALHDSARALGVPNVHSLVSASLTKFVATLANARAVLTMDTAAAHFATALDKPTVVILGGGHYGHFGPWHRSTKQVWLSNQLPCFGCDWKCIYPKPICITDIPPSQIADAVINVLKQS